ncbi:MAG: family N-acetyltransferase [Flavipsychrobacter sp.]|jgi:GNAT superfamily N-acetyltransferase|nr:family N-acetyltransferase [Flavipsychrobacter sp.]
MQPVTIDYKGYTITTDKSMMNVHDVHLWLSERSYWVPGIAFEKVKAAFDNSYCIAAIKDNRQVGYGRLVTDYAFFAYLADVYVEEEHRGKGISKAMMKILFEQDWVTQLRGVMLATKDAHDLYRQFGFSEIPNPERYMKLTLQETSS